MIKYIGMNTPLSTDNTVGRWRSFLSLEPRDLVRWTGISRPRIMHLFKRPAGLPPSSDFLKLSSELGISVEVLEFIEPTDPQIREVATEALVRIAYRRLSDYMLPEVRMMDGRARRWKQAETTLSLPLRRQGTEDC
jgi:hypothetical protein